MNFLTKLFSRKQDSFSREGIIVKTAFTIGGIEYLEIDNIYSLPYKRGLKAVQVYEEVRMKCDYEYLKAHTLAIDNIYLSNKIGYEEISKIKRLNDQLKERLFHIIDTDIIYKLAAVVFFDKNESPFDYDESYCRKKIAHWKKHESASEFFFREPLTRLIPFLKLPEDSLKTYSEAISQINRIDWEFLFSLISASQKKDYSEVKDYYVGTTLPESVN